jgi:signal transduction histidine kinase/CheY-like chemotaxis protein
MRHLQSTEKYVELYDFAPTGYFTLDKESKIIETNFAGASMLSKPRSEIINKYFVSYLLNEAKPVFNHFLQKVFESKTKEDCETALITNDDIPVWLHLSGIVAADGKCLINALDITLLKITEFELIKAKAKAEENDLLKSAFLANMSHEIRTPLNGILGFADLLKLPMLKDEKREKYIDIIEKSGRHLLTLINDIISISKVESGQMEIFISETNINDQIDYVYTFFKPEVEKKGVRLFYKNGLPNEEAAVHTDPDKIVAVLINLVKNAIKFTEEGSIEFGYVKKGAFLEFFVKDTGHGIRNEQKEIIFERFRKINTKPMRNFEGAGLGLSISKAYVELLGGQIWVESEFETGSVFYFTIPCTPVKKSLQHNEKQEGHHHKPHASINNLKILIAEDDEFSEVLIRETVKSFAKETITVKSGIEAVETCKSHPGLDLILMDIRMSKMDGYTATRQIRNFDKNVVIILQTAFGSDAEIQKGIDAGCNDFISKPFNQEMLIKLMKKHFKVEA